MCWDTFNLFVSQQTLLKEVSSHLKDPIWSEADSSYYQTVVKTHLKHLSSLVSDSLVSIYIYIHVPIYKAIMHSLLILFVQVTLYNYLLF